MLINCVAYENGRKLADISVDDISDWLHKPASFVWLALRDPSDEELAQMQQEFGLHELAVEDARKGHQRPKIEEYGDMVFVVLHLPDPSPDADAEDVGEVAIFVGHNYVLSVRRRSKQGFLGVRERCEREPLLETIEEHIFDHGAARGNIERLYALKRRTTVLRHAAGPLLEVAGKLHGGRVPEVCTGAQEYFRDVHDHLSRINGSIDTIRDTIGTAIQVNLSMVTIEESETTKRLAAWAAIFAVSTALAGIWGMNFDHMPELKWAFGYPMALAVIFCSGAVLYWRFRKTGWL